MTRILMAATAAYLLTCGFASAQMGASAPSPFGTTSPLGMTSPLGTGPAAPVPPTGIPLGTTELGSVGVSPTTSGNIAGQSSNNEQHRDVCRHQFNRRQLERRIRHGGFEPRVRLALRRWQPCRNGLGHLRGHCYGSYRRPRLVGLIAHRDGIHVTYRPGRNSDGLDPAGSRRRQSPAGHSDP